MPSYNTCHLTWVSLTLGLGYLFMAAPAKHSCCSFPCSYIHLHSMAWYPIYLISFKNSFDELMFLFVSSVQFSHSVVSDSLQPHESQHARPSCSSPFPGVHSDSRPLSKWCHPAISSSVVPFSSCPQSYPASESFQMSQSSASSGQSIRVSASASVLPMNTQDWSPLGRTGWISLRPRDPQQSSPTPQFKSINSLVLSFLYSPTLTYIHDHWKNRSLD